MGTRPNRFFWPFCCFYVKIKKVRSGENKEEFRLTIRASILRQGIESEGGREFGIISANRNEEYSKNRIYFFETGV
ncbi:hypothetical protein DLM77_18445 [Leptospira yasudae]|uniref:Uncharacterized protein n=1 Tax=Leptospira yasudae TaxID=2202201 RepID=A0ABX9LYR4_9LEPT|nr:hypothetical protein DLM77_18445 [Leptospira yasudae]